MKHKQKYQAGEYYEIAEHIQYGEPVIEIGFVDIDRSVFTKTEHEKAILKAAKAQAKQE